MEAPLPAGRGTVTVRNGRKGKEESYVNGALTIKRIYREGGLGHWTIRIFWKGKLVFSGASDGHATWWCGIIFKPRVTTFVRGAWEQRLESLWRRGTTVPRRFPSSRWRPCLP